MQKNKTFYRQKIKIKRVNQNQTNPYKNSTKNKENPLPKTEI